MAITKAAFTEDCGLFATPQGLTSPPPVDRRATVVLEGRVNSKRHLERGSFYGRAFLSLKSTIL